MQEYILGIDQGSTGSKALIVDKNGEVVCSAYRRIKLYCPEEGYAQHDGEEIWESVRDSLIELSEKFDFSQLKAISITNQRQTWLLWERGTGKPLTPALSWADRRSEYIIERWVSFAEEIQEKTGLEPHSNYSASQLAWYLEKDPDLRARAEKAEVCFGTMDTWLLYRLTGGKSHYTDSTNADPTLFLDIHKNCYDKELLAKMGIPECILPKVLNSDAYFGDAVEPTEVFKNPVPIKAMLGDQQGAIIGQCCFERGEAKCTIGTVINLAVFTDKFEHSKLGFDSEIAKNLGGKLTYEIEGWTPVGSAVQEWVVDKLNIADSVEEISALAQEVDSSSDVIFVPSFQGHRAPYWDANARAVLVGMSMYHDKRHVCRAALESIALQTNDIIEYLKTGYGVEVQTLRVDGGAIKNDFICQLLADFTRCTIVRPVNTECTPMGGIYIAGLASGMWKDINEIKKTWKVDKKFEPTMSIEKRNNIVAHWKEAVMRSLNWANI